jgi:hypothetical protein
MKKNYYFLFVTICALIINFTDQYAFAQWTTNVGINTPICVQDTFQFSPVIVSDGAGGAIMAWEDYRNGNQNIDIYAQRVDAFGDTLWKADGIQVCSDLTTQISPRICSDGAKGAIIAWTDFRGPFKDIYAQRIDSSGNIVWKSFPNSVPICQGFSTQEFSSTFPQICSDDSGGAIMIWMDRRNDVTPLFLKWDVYAQKVDANGNVKWQVDGVPVCTAADDQEQPVIVSDNAGGAIATWKDYRSGNWDIYAQRLRGSDGAALWGSNELAICTVMPGGKSQPGITSDGGNGAYIIWGDPRSSGSEVYMQRVDSSGIVKWATNGISVCALTSSKSNPVITSGESNDAFIAWEDSRNMLNTAMDIYAQRIDTTITPLLWNPNGVEVTEAPNPQNNPMIVSDQQTGVIVCWQDHRNLSQTDIFAQRLQGSNGMRLWYLGNNADGIPISSAPRNKNGQVITTDCSKGAIIAWQDNRDATQEDIYAQNIRLDGSVGKPGLGAPNLESVADVSWDQGGRVLLRWGRSWFDMISYQTITNYSVWRGVGSNSKIDPSKIITPDKISSNFSGEAYRIIQTDKGPTYWEWIANLPAHYLENYSYTAATLSDSNASTTPYFKFFVSAHTADPFTFWDSNIDSGYSVDNLHPSGPTMLQASLQAGPSVRLTWDKNIVDPDVKFYEIYRSTVNGFTPNPTTKLANSLDTVFIDNSPIPDGPNYYRVITIDLHDNKSSPSPQAMAANQVTAQLSMKQSWNMISVPMVVPIYRKIVLFPSAISNAFLFSNGYVSKDTLSNATGYWLKFPKDTLVSLSGYTIGCDTFDVTPGWNMIGSISSAITTSSIIQEPSNIVTSNYYGYSNGYFSTDIIYPAKGYWVKVKEAGKLILGSPVK